MENIKDFISSELRYPTSNSKKKKRYVTYHCTKCNKVTETVYQKSSFNNLCTHCAKGGFTTTEFIERGKKHFGDLYDYSKTVYINKRTPVTIICPTHGEFTQSAQEHMSGYGCNRCKYDNKSIDLLTPREEWLKRIEKFPLISFKSLDFELGYHSQVEFVCKLHGEFKTNLGSLQSSKHVCVHCSYTAHQSQSIKPEHIGKEAHIYYVYLPKIDMYKIGVTLNKEARFKALGEVQVIETKAMEYTEACKLEHLLMTKLDKYRYKGRQILVKNGSTELFKQDVAKHIKRALQEQSCNETSLN